ncbi:MAG: CotH kinase family protein [bacterium]|nr:CotH kinase family protein [bacterium]
MNRRKKKAAGFFTLLLAGLLLTGCEGSTGSWGFPEPLVSPDETYEKTDSAADSHLEDKLSLYEEDDLPMVTMYLTVGQGNADDGTNHTWAEVNAYSFEEYEEMGLDSPYQCEAVLQVGDEAGPVQGEFGYGVTAANAVVQIRGENASEQEQKSYRIDIKQGKGKWEDQKVVTLNKHVGDPLRITNKLCYSLMEGIPGMFSARTRFVHLYVKDKTEGEDGLFVDYGLFTQTEQINKTYLKNHGLDEDGNLYKAENFDWGRHEDSIQPATASSFDQDAFEQYLEIKGSNNDHSGLIEMLEAVNDPSRNIREVLDTYFDRKNLYSWMAFHMLIGNKDTAHGSYYLYKPQAMDKWYFISWNNSGAFSEIFTRMRDEGYSASWSTGIFTYTGNVLFERIFQDEKCREEFADTVELLYEEYLTPEKIASLAEPMLLEVQKQVYSLPDSLHVKVTREEQEQIVREMAQETERNFYLFWESLEQPWPFHILEPQAEEDALTLCWEEAYCFQDPEEKTPVTYTVELADNYRFQDCIAKESKVEGTSLTVQKLPPGQYFIRVRAETSTGSSQDACEHYYTEQGTTIYSTQCFYIHEDGSAELSLYTEED